eukprot:Nk52_evm13s1607 gene=Nk52_evmTU13s1607
MKRDIRKGRDFNGDNEKLPLAFFKCCYRRGGRLLLRSTMIAMVLVVITMGLLYINGEYTKQKEFSNVAMFSVKKADIRQVKVNRGEVISNTKGGKNGIKVVKSKKFTKKAAPIEAGQEASKVKSFSPKEMDEKEGNMVTKKVDQKRNNVEGKEGKLEEKNEVKKHGGDGKESDQDKSPVRMGDAHADNSDTNRHHQKGLDSPAKTPDARDIKGKKDTRETKGQTTFDWTTHTTKPLEPSDKIPFLDGIDSSFFCKADARPSQIDMEILKELGPIDIVYTWVNGSDVTLLRQHAEWMLKMFGERVRVDPTRITDNGELRHSLRTLWKYVEWFRHIYIITNDQTPSWLNTSHPCISLVSADSIFKNKAHIPSFSSVSIEWNMHYIKGLSNHFLYLNDDFHFNRRASLSYWYSLDKGYKLYGDFHVHWDMNTLYRPTKTQTTRSSCIPHCPDTFLGNGICDVACDFPECAGDMGDCAKVYPTTKILHPIKSGFEYVISLDTPAVFIDLTVLFESLPVSKADIFSPKGMIQSLKVFDQEKACLILFESQKREGILEVTFRNELFGVNKTVRILRSTKLKSQDASPAAAPSERSSFLPVHPLNILPEALVAPILKNLFSKWCIFKAPHRRNVDALYKLAAEWILHPVNEERLIDNALKLLHGFLQRKPPNEECNLNITGSGYSFAFDDKLNQERSERPFKRDLYILPIEIANTTELIPFHAVQMPKHSFQAYKLKVSGWAGSVTHSNRVIQQRYGSTPANRAVPNLYEPIPTNAYPLRFVVPHMPFLVNAHIVENLKAAFPEEVEHSSAARFRSVFDMQYPFTYNNYLRNEMQIDKDILQAVFQSCDDRKDYALTRAEEVTCMISKSPNPYAVKLWPKLMDALYKCALKCQETFLETKRVSEGSREEVLKWFPLSWNTFANCEEGKKYVRSLYPSKARYKKEMVPQSLKGKLVSFIPIQDQDYYKNMRRIHESSHVFVNTNDHATTADARGNFTAFFASRHPEANVFEKQKAVIKGN